jgi:ABC-type branched-subunit amino acid transport system ATPase component
VFVTEIGRVVQRLKAAGTTVLMVEQNVRLALAVADRFVALRDGLVLAHGRWATSRAPTKTWCVASTSSPEGFLPSDLYSDLLDLS